MLAKHISLDTICKRHVYLIEDDVELRAYTAEALESSGLTVLQFATAEAFLQEQLTYSPAVIVTDMVLPGISGVELLRSVRETGHTCPLIFISGYSEPIQIIDGMKLGAVDFLLKPFKFETLLNAVEKSLLLDTEQRAIREAQEKIDRRWHSLSKREQEVCGLMMNGYGNSAISVKLGIKPDTVNKHRMKILKKMGVSRRTELFELLKGSLAFNLDVLSNDKN